MASPFLLEVTTMIPSLQWHELAEKVLAATALMKQYHLRDDLVPQIEEQLFRECPYPKAQRKEH